MHCLTTVKNIVGNKLEIVAYSILLFFISSLNVTAMSMADDFRKELNAMSPSSFDVAQRRASVILQSLLSIIY
jgi:hypothetical protein